MKLLRMKFALALCLLPGLILSACISGDSVSSTADPSLDRASVQSSATVDGTDQPVLEPGSQGKPPASGADAPVPAGSIVTPAASAAAAAAPASIAQVKTELQATDPGVVNLASGQLQLIEFFAFW